jgi:FixJ family two-component response regulator
MESPGCRTVKARPVIVLIEDDNGVRRSMQLLLQGRGFDVKAYSSAAPVLADPHLAQADCLVADYRLGETNGIEVLRSLRARGWRKPAVLITAFYSADTTSRAAEAGFDIVFDKPVKDHVLIAALERLTSAT